MINVNMYAVQHKGKTIPIKKSVTQIGRHTDNDIVINSDKVSRFHANICLMEDYVFIEDLEAPNGIYIGTKNVIAEKILPKRLTNIKIDDIIGLGCKPDEDEECDIKLIRLNCPIESSSTTGMLSTVSRMDNRVPSVTVQPSHPIYNLNVTIQYSNEASKDTEDKDHTSKQHWKMTDDSKEVVRANINGNQASEHARENTSHTGSNVDASRTNRKRSTSQDRGLNVSRKKTDSSCSDSSKNSNSEKHERKHSTSSTSHRERQSCRSSRSKISSDGSCDDTNTSSSKKDSNIEKHERKHSKSSTSTRREHRSRKRSRSRTKILSNGYESKPSTSSTSTSKERQSRKYSRSISETSSDGNSDISNSSEKVSNNEKYESKPSTSSTSTHREHQSRKSSKSRFKTSSDGKSTSKKSSRKVEKKKSSNTTKTDDQTEKSDTSCVSEHKTIKANPVASCKHETDSNNDVKSTTPVEVRVEPKDVINLTNDDESKRIKSDVISLLEDDSPQTTSTCVDREIASVRINLVDDDEPITTINLDPEGPEMEREPIAISSDEEVDVRPRIPPNVCYSKLDDIISLDSDDEDFPSSQMFDATTVDSMPDYAPAFQMMYDYEIKEEPEEQSQILQCHDSMWFEPLSQGNHIEEKMVPKTVDSPDSPTLFSSSELSDRENETEEVTEEMIKKFKLKRCSLSLPRSSECERFLKAMKRRSLETVDNETDDELIVHKKSLATKSPFRQEDDVTHTSPPLISSLRKKQAKNTVLRKTILLEGKIRKKKGRISPEGPTSSQKQRIKEVKIARKEKLKELTIKSTTNQDCNAVVKPKVVKPVAKITDKNRNTMLAEAIGKMSDVPVSTATTNKKSATEANKKRSPSRSTLKEVDLWNTSGDGQLLDDILNATPRPTTNDSLMWEKPTPIELAKMPTELKKTKSRSDESTPKMSPPISILKKKPKAGSGPKTGNKTVNIDKRERCIKEINVDRLEQDFKKEVMTLIKSLQEMADDFRNESDAATAHMGSWNVRWLTEQLKNAAPPPVYTHLTENDANELVSKENLKYRLFLQLWQAIFRKWNTIGNYIVPNTQYSNEKSTITLTAEKIEAFPEKNTLLIMASRVIDENALENEIQIGHVVIVRLPHTIPGHEIEKKTNIFAYTINATKVFDENSSQTYQQVWMKTAYKPTIAPGSIKLMVIGNFKIHLKRFQALAMLCRSPLTNFIRNPSTLPLLPSTVREEEILQEQKFLGTTQAKAIAKCLNAIYSKNPSVCTIDGSPGTGKTQIIVSLIKELYSANRKDMLPEKTKIIIITPFDHLADDLCYRMQKTESFEFMKYDVEPQKAVKPYLFQKKIEDLVRGDTANKLIDLKTERNHVEASIRAMQLAETSVTDKKRADDIADRTNLLNEMNKENSSVVENLKAQAARQTILSKADIVVTSLQTSWSYGFEQDFVPTTRNRGDIEKFTVCIMDDANRIPQQDLLIPIMLMVPNLILIGDSKNQIFPQSSFTAFRQTCKEKAPMELLTLDYGYRLPLRLQTWVNKQFATRTTSTSHANKPTKIKPLLVVDFSPQRVSNLSLDDVEMTYLFIDLILEIDKIEEKTTRVGVVVFDEKQKENFKSLLLNGNPKIFVNRKLSVATMEEFIGREHDIVVVYIPSDRRLNNAFLYNVATRVKKSFIVCGYFNHDNLKNVTALDSLIQYAKQRDVYVPNPTKNNLIPLLYNN